MEIDELVDEGSFAPVRDDLSSSDPLAFPGYRDALNEARRDGRDESVLAGAARIDDHEIELAWFDFGFLAGSMGEVAGERIARAIERAASRGVPFLLRTSTGGARMQEGMRALVQMPKVVAARLTLAESHQPFIAVFGHPTTGGVLASVASLADITIAEAGATIGFAGPRVAQRATGRPLSDASHTAASALAHGLVDAVTDDARATRAHVAQALAVLVPDDSGARASALEPERRPSEAAPASSADAWSHVEAARAEKRPEGHRLISELDEHHFPLRGDRSGTDDPALACALARVAGRRVLLLALNRTWSPGPGAYRKARRCLAIATRLGLPVVTLVDTPGADAGEEAEAGGIAWEIGALFEAMLQAPVPVVSIVTGEGGSGGALAFACGDMLLIYEDAIFSVIGPELAAEILWRDAARASEAAELQKLTAHDLARLGIADAVIEEPLGVRSLGQAVAYHLDRLSGTDGGADERAARRRRRWRNITR